MPKMSNPFHFSWNPNRRWVGGLLDPDWDDVTYTPLFPLQQDEVYRGGHPSKVDASRARRPSLERLGPLGIRRQAGQDNLGRKL